MGIDIKVDIELENTSLKNAIKENSKKFRIEVNRQLILLKRDDTDVNCYRDKIEGIIAKDEEKLNKLTVECHKINKKK